MLKTTICIARLRSGDNYIEPLYHIMDSFYECLKEFVNKNSHKYNFTYYNFGFSQAPKRNPEALEQADIIIIPSEAEFTYHIPGLLHTLDVKNSNIKLEAIKTFFQNKKVINLRSDRDDTEELYRTSVLDGVNFTYRELQELDFTPNLHVMKYYFIKDKLSTNLFFSDKILYDFVYWGTARTVKKDPIKNERQLILKELYDDPDIKTWMIGRFHKIKRDQKFSKLVNIVPDMQRSVTTCCFGWNDPKATSARYCEALGGGLIPYIWKNDYDSDNKYGILDYQRCYSIEDLKLKIHSMKSEKLRTEIYNNIQESFLSKILPKEEYLEQFNNKLIERIEG